MKETCLIQTVNKLDAGKSRLDLIHPEIIKALGAGYDNGLIKYGENTWQTIEIKRYEAAMLRHWLSWKEGEHLDKESGLPHIWHMLWNAGTIVALSKGLYEDEVKQK